VVLAAGATVTTHPLAETATKARTRATPILLIRPDMSGNATSPGETLGSRNRCGSATTSWIGTGRA